MRKNHSASFKAQLVLELLKEEQTVSELASTYGVHSILGLPRIPSLEETAACRLAVLGSCQGFERDQDARAARDAHEKRIEELYILGLPRICLPRELARELVCLSLSGRAKMLATDSPRTRIFRFVK
jgi:hypothetical protein